MNVNISLKMWILAGIVKTDELVGSHEMGVCVTSRLKGLALSVIRLYGEVGLHPKHSQYPSVESERLQSGLTHRTHLKLGSRASTLNRSVSG